MADELTSAQARDIALAASRAERVWLGIGLGAVAIGLTLVTFVIPSSGIFSRMALAMLPGAAVIWRARNRQARAEYFAGLAAEPGVTWVCDDDILEAREDDRIYRLVLPRRTAIHARALPSARVVRDQAKSSTPPATDR